MHDGHEAPMRITFCGLSDGPIVEDVVMPFADLRRYSCWEMMLGASRLDMSAACAARTRI
jgi:hypothetical protein